MKNLIKIIVIIGILCAIFGTATVKGWISVGVDKGVDKIGDVANNIKNSDQFKNISSEVIGNAKSGVADFIGDAMKGQK